MIFPIAHKISDNPPKIGKYPWWYIAFFLWISLPLCGAYGNTNQKSSFAKSDTIYITDTQFDRSVYGLVEDTSLRSGYAVYYKGDANIENSIISIDLTGLDEGTYSFSSYSFLISKADNPPNERFWSFWQWNDEDVSARIIYDNVQQSHQSIGLFDLSGHKKVLKIQIPVGVALGYITWNKFAGPAEPDAFSNYRPKIIPPKDHPRLWVTPSFLPELRQRIHSSENAPAWREVQRVAQRDYKFEPDTSGHIYYSGNTDQSGLTEQTLQAKAFYYLITNDKRIGNQAVQLLEEYYRVLYFGNALYGDISRPIGRAMYIGSLVYDWCYDLLDDKQKTYFRQRMMQLSRKMDPGWPPFGESIINGHGNEAQINRDLLAMSIAVYNEDPMPYQYISYLVLENLVPMRSFEYQSPRHNQGVDYGAYRFGWEMHAAWLFYRMSGTRVFDCNIENMPYFWQYMRLPGGQMLRDGDRFNVHDSDSSYYWKQPLTALLTYAYNQDEHLKAEFESQGGLPENPVLYLLLNDPGIKAKRNYEDLPLTRETGPVLGSMIARTGWDMSYHSNDVIAEIKGGGYHFGNHQHSDAGAIQIYYKGFQVGDLGLYLSYGSVYDFNFNKRSIAHSVMLAVDPEEEIIGARHIPREEYYDGGTRFNQRFPTTPKEVQNDPWFDNGSVVSTDFGPSQMHPEYSYFKVELSGAYSPKMSDYAREFCFLNLDHPDVPAAIILMDNMTTSKEEFKKHWQINTLHTPIQDGDDWLVYNHRNRDTGWTRVQMLMPEPEFRETEVLSGAKTNSNFEIQFNINSKLKEANGHRIMVSPVRENITDRFLTVFQMTSDPARTLPVQHIKTSESHVTWIGDFVVSMSSSGSLINRKFHIELPKQKWNKVLITGLEPGFWNVKDEFSGEAVNFNVKPAENTIFFQTMSSEMIISPGRVYGKKTIVNGHSSKILKNNNTDQ